MKQIPRSTGENETQGTVRVLADLQQLLRRLRAQQVPELLVVDLAGCFARAHSTEK